ncbi:hypothetical protein PPHE_a2862 [Pseudoalteromonas phenolica O-BC30]|nr:hypothetical protein [Pseudoalteromonas phenolica O-BC30]
MKNHIFNCVFQQDFTDKCSQFMSAWNEMSSKTQVRTVPIAFN